MFVYKEPFGFQIHLPSNRLHGFSSVVGLIGGDPSFTCCFDSSMPVWDLMGGIPSSVSCLDLMSGDPASTCLDTSIKGREFVPVLDLLD